MEAPTSAGTLLLDTTVITLVRWKIFELGQLRSLHANTSDDFIDRICLFYACHRYLLHSLYHDLQTLNVSSSQHDDKTSESGAEEHELQTLPTHSATVVTTQLNGAARRGTMRSLHTSVARTSFSLCFSESCTLFLMVICQATSLFHPKSRDFNWKASIFILISMILLVIPLSQTWLLTFKTNQGTTNRKRSILWRLILTGVPYSVYLLSLSHIPLPADLASQGLLSAALSRLIVLGTLTLGLFSGFGAIHSAWDFLPLISKSTREPTEQDVVAAEQALLRVRSDLTERRLEQGRREGGKQPAGVSWLSTVMPSFRGNSEANALQREIDGLAALEYQMDRNLEALKQNLASVKFTHTLRGKFFKWGGRLFALYCVYRVISSAVNILKPLGAHNPDNRIPKTTYPDIIAHLLAYMVSLLPSIHLTTNEISAIAREVSLGLVGVIILSSVRLVLRGVSRLLRVTSQNLAASLMLLILAQLMGTYLLSTLVQLRTAFPPPVAQPDTGPAAPNLFSTLPEFEVFGSLFDWSFLLSALSSIVLRWADQKINGVEW